MSPVWLRKDRQLWSQGGKWQRLELRWVVASPRGGDKGKSGLPCTQPTRASGVQGEEHLSWIVSYVSQTGLVLIQDSLVTKSVASINNPFCRWATRVGTWDPEAGHGPWFHFLRAIATFFNAQLLSITRPCVSDHKMVLEGLFGPEQGKGCKLTLCPYQN